MKFYILILDFEISLPPIPEFENKSWNFLFSFWILKSHCRQYHNLKIKVEIFIFDFEISLPPIPEFENKSWNFIFSFWIFKSHYSQYHSLKIKDWILYSHFEFSNLTAVHKTGKNLNLNFWCKDKIAFKACQFYITFVNNLTTYRTWQYILLFFKTKAFYTYCILSVGKAVI